MHKVCKYLVFFFVCFLTENVEEFFFVITTILSLMFKDLYLDVEIPNIYINFEILNKLSWEAFPNIFAIY